jgi:hypothetical protein
MIRTVGVERAGPLQLGGYRVGIFGVMTPAESRWMGPARDSVEVTDPIEAARRTVEELRKKEHCRMIIALSHQGLEGTRKLAAAVPGIDLLVVGHGGTPLETPERLGEAFMVYSGSLGASLGDMVYNIGPDGPPLVESHQVVKLGSDIAADAAGEAMLAAYKKDYQKYLEDPQEMPRALERADQVFAGVEACAPCHQEIVASWKASPHARAFAALEATGDDINPDCVSCHVTGYMNANGFQHRKWTPRFGNVQCEACHGPAAAHAENRRAAAEGRAHAPLRAFPQITAQACQECHHGKDDPDFRFERDLALARHPSSAGAGSGK